MTSNVNIIAITHPKFLRFPTQDDLLLLKEAKAMGVDMKFISWKDTTKDLLISTYCSGYTTTICIVRSLGDYLDDAESGRLQEWLRMVGEVPNLVLVNSLFAIEWCLNKANYFDALSAPGHDHVVRMVPYAVLPKRSTCADVSQILKKKGWMGDIIMKPCIGSLGLGIRHIPRAFEAISTSTSKSKSIDALLRDKAMLIQPFLNSIFTAGEISCVFIGGTWSHTVLKVPSRGDYRVQGGTQIVMPKEKVDALNIAEMVEHTWRMLPGWQSLLQGRIDLMFDPVTGWLVSEIELIDPDLYIGIGAAIRLISAILKIT